ncbi:protein kinase, partial [bacterium]|nr:protein kinase [bacterium]
ERLISTLGKFNCEPAKALYHVTNGKSDKSGFHLTSIISNKPLRSKYVSGLKVKNGIGMVGSGVDGVVYVGCLDKACKLEIAIKMASDQDNRLEYNFMTKFAGISPNISHAFYYKKCPSPVRSVLYTEYYAAGSLKRLLLKNENRLRKLHYRVIIFQILWTLAELHKKFPSFRHNDLHLDNIFIDDRVTTDGSLRYGEFEVPFIGMNAVIGDFGFANMQADGFKNRKVQSGTYKTDYGIYTTNDYRYDLHFFLNDLYLTTTNADVKRFIKRNIPPEYLAATSPVVMNSRLRAGMNHSGLPSFEKLLSDKFFRFFRPKGNTVIPPVNMYPQNAPTATLSPMKTAFLLSEKKSPSTKSPLKKAPRRVIARPFIQEAPVVKKTFNAEAIKKHLTKPEVRPVPKAPAPKSRLVKPAVSPSKLKASPKANPKPKAKPIKSISPPKAKPTGAKIQMRLNARKAGVVLNKNSVKFINGSSRGKKCESFKKDEVVAKAKKLGITGVEKLSKEKICVMIKNALA